MLTLLTLSLFSLGLLSCSSTPSIYKPVELKSIQELETGQKIIYYSSDENLASYLKQRLEREIPKINNDYGIQNLPVTFYIIPTYQDWKKYYCFGDHTWATSHSKYEKFGAYEVFILSTNQHKLVSEAAKNNNIASNGFNAARGYEQHAKNIIAE